MATYKCPVCFGELYAEDLEKVGMVPDLWGIVRGEQLVAREPQFEAKSEPLLVEHNSDNNNTWTLHPTNIPLWNMFSRKYGIDPDAGNYEIPVLISDDAYAFYKVKHIISVIKADALALVEHNNNNNNHIASEGDAVDRDLNEKCEAINTHILAVFCAEGIRCCKQLDTTKNTDIFLHNMKRLAIFLDEFSTKQAQYFYRPFRLYGQRLMLLM